MASLIAKKEGQQALLLPRRKRPRRRQAAHRSPDLPRQRREGRRPGPGSFGSAAAVGHLPRSGPARRPVARRHSRRVFSICCNRIGRSPGPVPRRRTISCWLQFIASASRDPRRRLPTGTKEPSCHRSGIFLRSGSPRRPSGIASTQSGWVHWIRNRWTGTISIARSCGFWRCGRTSRLVSHRLLSYDSTNFYTFVASTNGRNTIAQRGHNKQGRHNLRQVGLSYVLDGVYGLSLCHHVYPGNVPDTEEFSNLDAAAAAFS